MADTPSKSRPMKYPYTTAAQIAQFPYRHYMKHSWLMKYWMIAIVVCAPLFIKIQKLCMYHFILRDIVERMLY